MWYKPKSKEKLSENAVHKIIWKARKELSELLGIDLNLSDICTDFLSYYKSQVFCSWDELSILNLLKIDVIIFSGYAGVGHFAPSKALAEKYAREGKSVIIIDPLFLYSEQMAIFNCRSWEFMAKYSHTSWAIISKMVSTQIGTEVIFGNIKQILEIDKIISFILSKNVDIVLSCYPYANTIIPAIAEHVKLAGVVVLDCTPVGFMNSPDKGKGVEKVVYFVPGEDVIKKGKKMYSYIKNSKFVNIHGTPCMFDKLQEKHKDVDINDICLFIPGSGLGIGKAIFELSIIAEKWKGKVICICGDNSSWIKLAENVSLKYPNLIVTGYVKHEVLKELMLISKIIIAKPGASLKEEMAVISGYNIAYGEIVGQEKHNAKKLDMEERAIWVKDKESLVKYFTEIYPSGEISCNREYDLPFATEIIYTETKKYCLN